MHPSRRVAGPTGTTVHPNCRSAIRGRIVSSQCWRYSRDKDLAAAERKARAKRIGLWEDPPVAPWEWRDKQRKAGAETAAGTAADATGYWLDMSTGVRHNSTCENWGRTKRGRPCGPGEGRPCGMCGGYPAHVVAAWMGHSVIVSAKHYLQVTDSEFDKAVQKAVQSEQTTSVSGAPTRRQAVQETAEKPVFSRVFLPPKIAGAGLEPAREKPPSGF